MLGNFAAVAVAVVVRTRPRAIPLAIKTMRKSLHGFRLQQSNRAGKVTERIQRRILGRIHDQLRLTLI